MTMPISFQKKTEAVLPPHLVARLLEEAGENVILVGGQALSYWVTYFSIEIPSIRNFISRDIDFLAKKASDFHEVKRFAKILDGYPIFPTKHALTALIGQAVKEISDSEYFNIDVLHKIYSGTEGVRRRAVSVNFHEKRLMVMHPFDVLASRLVNLHKLAAKQNEIGADQLRLSIDVARAYLAATASNATMQFYASLAKGDAGKKVSERWGIHVADAIDPLLVDPEELSELFFDNQWPHIKKLMSLDYQERMDLRLVAHFRNHSEANR